MAQENYGDIIPLPGTSSVNEVKPADILYSYSRLTQKGGTIKKVGAGSVIEAGTVMAFDSGSKKYVAYSGGDAAKCVLRQTVSTVDGDAAGNLVFGGVLKLDLVIGLDAGALTDLGAREDTDRNILFF